MELNPTFKKDLINSNLMNTIYIPQSVTLHYTALHCTAAHSALHFAITKSSQPPARLPVINILRYISITSPAVLTYCILYNSILSSNNKGLILSLLSKAF
jgi:hypothetical protein